MKKILLVATALVAGMTVGLDAQDGDKKGKGGKGKGDPAKRIEMMFEKFDTDKNGSISKAEFAASPIAGKIKEKGGENSIDKLFAARDKNSDGELTKKELAAPRARGTGGPGGKKPEGKKKKAADS